VLDDAASKTPGTPEWWLLRLGKRLAEEGPRFDRLESYWRGNPPHPHGNSRMREAYKRLQRMARTNFGALIAEAVLERMKVMGFRAGVDASDDADMEAWRWWQRNGLDADSGLLHRAAVVLSRAYVIVGQDPEDEGQPLVTVEDPRQVIHESHPTNRRRVIAALKTYWDDIENTQVAVLFLPDRIHYFRAVGVKRESNADHLWNIQRWEADTVDGETSIANPFDGDIPVTPFVNRPDMAGNGLGEYEDVLDILDRINTVILDRLVISAMQAYRQRWAKGVRLTDENGNDTSAFDPGADLLWAVEDEAAQFGEFSTTDLTPIVKAIESDVQYLSAITRTPPHYILAGIVNASGDALSVAETGLTSKVVEREFEFGESWERVYRLVGRIMGRTISTDAEVLWKDPQFRSLTEMASASVQLKGADVPWRTRMRLLDMSPQDIDRMEAERMQDAMQMALMAPLLAPAQQGPYQPGMPTATSPGPTGNTEGGLREPERPTESRRASQGRSTSGSDGGTGGTAIGDNSTWDALYARARAAGVRGASRMTKAELLAAVGG
jgi:hypothetical protein